MQSRNGTTTPCLQKELAEQRITHDNYFHSVLGLMDVQTGAYKPELDMFAGCKKNAALAGASNKSVGSHRS